MFENGWKQQQYRQCLRKCIDLLLGYYIPLFGPQIGFIQISMNLIEKKALSLSKLIAVQIELLGVDLEHYKTTSDYQMNRLLQKTIQIIDDVIEGFQTYFGTGKYWLIYYFIILCNQCLSYYQEQFSLVQKSFGMILDSMRATHDLLSYPLIHEPSLQLCPVNTQTERNRKEEEDGDVSWFFEESEKGLEVNEGYPVKGRKGEIPDRVIIESLSHVTDQQILSSGSLQGGSSHFLINYAQQTIHHLWKHLLHSSFSPPSSSSEYFISELIQSLYYSTSSITETTSIDNQFDGMIDGSLRSSIFDHLQCKYVKGIGFLHSILALDTIMINCYHETTRNTFDYLLHQQESQCCLHYTDPTGKQKQLPAIDCQRILCYSCENEEEWWEYLLSSYSFQYEMSQENSSSNSSKLSRVILLRSSEELLLYHRFAQQFLLTIKEQFQRLNLEALICYGMIMNHPILHQQIVDLCQEIHVLFVEITNPSDYSKCQSFLSSDSFIDQLLSIQVTELCPHSLRIAQYSPIYELACSREQSEIHHRTAAQSGSYGIEIGEFHSQNTSFHLQDDEESEDLLEESILFGNNDYNCIIFLQLIPNNRMRVPELLKPNSFSSHRAGFVSVLLTSATTMQLQALFYQFYRILNKLRAVIHDRGRLLIGQGIPEIMQSLLLTERINRLQSDSSTEDNSIAIDLLQSFQRGLENWPRIIMKNHEGSSMAEIERRLDLSKDRLRLCLLSRSTLTSSIAHDVVQGAEAIAPIRFSDDEGFSYSSSSSLCTFDLPSVKYYALENATRLITRLLNLRIID